MAKKVEHVIIGGDLGNYSTEIKGADFLHTQITSIAYNSTAFPATDEVREKAVEKLMDNLKVHVKSDHNKINQYYYVGNASLNSGKAIDVLNIETGTKFDSKIPLVMLLSLIAGNQVQRAFEKDKECTETAVEVSLGTAIPASEFTTERAATLENRILGTHYVTVYFADTQCVVKITFKNAKVTEEGRTAMLHIFSLLKEDPNVFKDFEEKYGEKLNLTNTTFTLHYDIGNGTIEATYMKGLTPIVSDGKRAGVGIAIQNAVEAYNDEYEVELNRQEFVDILMSNSPTAELAKARLEEPMAEQLGKIMDFVDKTYKQLTKTQVEYIFAHGGGSIAIKNDISEKLYDYVHSKGKKLVYMKEEHAPHLNSNGCYELAVRLYGAKVGA